MRNFTAALSAMLVGSAYAGYDFSYLQNGADWGVTTTDTAGATVDWALCDSGTEQSPIDLVGGSSNDDLSIKREDYIDVRVDTAFEKSGSMKITGLDNSDPVPKLTLVRGNGDELTFMPVQFHFHAPSEHSVDGTLYDLEVHFVHVQPDGASLPYAVIGVFFDRTVGGNSENAFLKSMFEAISSKDDSDASKVAAVEFLDSLDYSDYWSYDGSLTTPPCTENVKWTVVTGVQPINDVQLLEWTQFLADDDTFANGRGNNRVIQSLGDRTLYKANTTADGTGEEEDNDGASALMGGLAAVAALAALSF